MDIDKIIDNLAVEISAPNKLTKYELIMNIRKYIESQQKTIESMKCCGNCIYYSDNVCLCNSIDVLEIDDPCGAWELKC